MFLKSILIFGALHNMAEDLTKGRPFSVILKFSLPIIGGNLFQLFYTTTREIAATLQGGQVNHGIN